MHGTITIVYITFTKKLGLKERLARILVMSRDEIE